MRDEGNLYIRSSFLFMDWAPLPFFVTGIFYFIFYASVIPRLRKLLQAARLMAIALSTHRKSTIIYIYDILIKCDVINPPNICPGHAYDLIHYYQGYQPG